MKTIFGASIFGTSLVGILIGIIAYEVYSRRMGHPGMPNIGGGGEAA